MSTYRPSIRLAPDEMWEFITNARVGILTTVRQDGTPIALPLWFVVIDRTIYVRTRGAKLSRIERNPRASFLVETGDRWAELRVAHLTGTANVVASDPELCARVERQLADKYDHLRTARADMPDAVRETYADATFEIVRFVPDDRSLTWDNSKLALGPPAGVRGDGRAERLS